ncbi:DNA-3-methyladenine glycosylase family protein [Arthrobacter cryoconiti]|uniref:DNA-3-methyladenine glycosylase II n=1 Tax=Arthrobacter cryoconiti TaxID=748907 RepID=A0ABV8QYM4_9MICC|nr:hypothetical protein [Arthrobacter cryoconiti]MCC9067504.1 hypothetical protein [Arthrobacter cryoconiti]
MPESAVERLESLHSVAGPWSLTTSRRFWEGFSPSALNVQAAEANIEATFVCDDDWQRVDAVISQEDDAVRIAVAGSGNLEAATAQVLRFLSLDIDGRGWPDVGVLDPVIKNAQQQLPGLRPCGFYSPYEAAVWSVLSQRVQMRQAAAIKTRLLNSHGDRGSFPTPSVLLGLDLDLPGRKNEYLQAVAEAALDGQLSGERLRALDAAEALRQMQEIKGIGPFAADLIVIRGANFPDVIPRNEKRLDAEIAEKYGIERAPAEISKAWAPFRSWASVYLRALREERTQEITRGRPEHRR